jgi:tellurite resistance protein TerC
MNNINSIGSPQMWIGFFIFVIIILLLDLGIFNRHNHSPSVKESLGWSIVWITLALVFNGGIYHFYGRELAAEFFTGYIIEKSLSVDNLFVFVLVFKAFKIPRFLQHKVLFWGIIGAIVFRIIFIFAGTALINQFHWTLYLFGGFLLYSGVKVAFEKKDHDEGMDSGKFIKFVRKFFPVDEHVGPDFFIKKQGKTFVTPLLICVLAVESTDIIFAVDSIPAIFAVTRDPFIVFTSNLFAILGLRSLYFLLADMVHRFVYLNIGLGIVLFFVGVKMVLMDFVKIPTPISLSIIFGVLTISIIASLAKKDTTSIPSSNEMKE